METKALIALIIGMAVATLATRLMPFVVLGKRKLPENFRVWLSYVPPAVLSAMLFPEVVLRRGHLAFQTDNLYLWGTLLAFAIGFATRNLFWTVLSGMGSVALLRLVA